MGEPKKRIGIIAGAGSLPLEVARSVTGRGGEVHIVMVDGAGATLDAYPHTAVNWAQLGRLKTALQREGIRDILILGGGARPSFRNARPDLAFILELPHVLRLLNAGGDDAVLRGFIGVLERHGFNVVGVGDVAKELIIGEGRLTATDLSPRHAADIARGFSLIAALGRFDIGQAAIVTDGRIEAIEGAEGTDRMLQRVAEARRNSGVRERRGVLVKRPKPGQDLRVDLPAIGPNTVRNIDAAGLAGIAVMAGHVLAAERDRMLPLADELGVFIVGVPGDVQPSEPRRVSSTSEKFVQRGRTPIVPATLPDMARAKGILSALKEFDTGSAVVIDGGRVISIGAQEPPADVIGRVAGLRGSNRKRKGIAAIQSGQPLDESLLRAVNDANLVGVVDCDGPASDIESLQQVADELNVFVATPDKLQKMASETGARELKVFIVAGEHSGDALGGKLIHALKKQYDGAISFAGVGGEDMAREGFASLFPIEDVAVMGPLSILPKLPRIVSRVYRTVDAAIAFAPDIVVIIDSPEFTHPIAKRIRKRAPKIPIVDYVCPSVWAWRPGRARRMRPYVDHVLCLLPFEPDALRRLSGPPGSYVGHPLIEKLDQIQHADAAGLAARLGLDPEKPVLLVLPGSRTSEVERLIDVFGEAVSQLASTVPLEVVIPAVRHVRDRIVEKTATWTQRPHIVDSEDKYAAMRLARAALAASGTVTLELALAQTPAVVAYKVDRLIASVRFLVKVPSVVLANLVAGKNVYPEFLQEACTAETLSSALKPLFGDTAERTAQIEGLAVVPEKMQFAASNPSEAAADVVLSILKDQAAGKSRRG